MADYVLDLKELAGGNYDELWKLKKGVTNLKTGKAAKKSTEIGKYIDVSLLLDPYMNAVVLRKVGIDHQTSTIPAILKGFNYISLLTGYNWKKYWEPKPGATKPHILNKQTGQKIYFVSFDRPDSLSGLDLEDPRMYYGRLWFEEPLQVSDKTRKSQMTEESEQRDFAIIESTAFRGVLPHDGAWRELILSYNDWSDGDSWLLNKYVTPFVIQDPVRLDKVGKQVTYDPEAFEGRGILSLIGTGALNEFHDDEYKAFIRDIRLNDPEFYKAIWLGTAATFSGNAYGLENIKKIRRDIDFDHVDVLLTGGDYSTTKDRTVMLLVGWNTGDGSIQVIDGEKIEKGKMDDVKKMDIMFSWLKKWEIKYKLANFVSEKAERRVRNYFDSRDATVISGLNQRMRDDKFITLTNKPFKGAAKFNTAASWIRVMSVRMIMSMGKLRIAPHLTWLINELKQREIYKDGSIKDGGDDGAQSLEYAISRYLRKILGKHAHNSILEGYAAIKAEQDMEGFNNGQWKN